MVLRDSLKELQAKRFEYYTPETEDFYEGYEYEMKSGEDWRPHVWPEPWWAGGGDPSGFDALIGEVARAGVRTAYLNQVKLTDLGWHDYPQWAARAEGKPENAMSLFMEYKHPGAWHMYHLIYTIRRHLLLTFARNGHAEDRTIFAGYCPSANEFRKIWAAVGPRP